MVTQVEVFTKRLKSTIVDWYYLYREVTVAEYYNHKKIWGPGLVFQMDKSLFQYKGKHNRWRLRLGDRKPEEQSNEDEESSDEDDVIEITENEFKDHGFLVCVVSMMAL
jgi:hypothetical protein